MQVDQQEGHKTQALTEHLEQLCNQLDAAQKETEMLIKSDEQEEQAMLTAKDKLHSEIEQLVSCGCNYVSKTSVCPQIPLPLTPPFSQTRLPSQQCHKEVNIIFFSNYI